MEVTLIIKIILAAIFALSVVAKLTGKTKSTFEDAGYPLSVMYAIAIAEIIFTVGLFTPYQLFAAVGLLGIMGGAIFTLYRQKVEPSKYALALLATALLIALLAIQISRSSSLAQSFNL